MTTKHETKGRLKVHITPMLGDIYLVPEKAIAPAGDDIVIVPNEATARRLTACWNLCEGIDTELLAHPERHRFEGTVWDQGLTHKKLVHQLIEARRERDHLRAELVNARSRIKDDAQMANEAEHMAMLKGGKS